MNGAKNEVCVLALRLFIEDSFLNISILKLVVVVASSSGVVQVGINIKDPIFEIKLYYETLKIMSHNDQYIFVKICQNRYMYTGVYI